MKRRDYLRVAGLCAGFAAGCSGPSRNGDSSRAVGMTDGFVFEPESVRIAAGTTVEWTNEGNAAHTVTAYEDRIPDTAAYFASGGFETEEAARNNLESGLIEADESYSHTFERSGQYHYFCIPHEGSGMTGTIRVK